MDMINNKLNSFFKWNLNSFFKAILGCFIFAFAVNVFLVPNSLYNGGILGIAQLLRSLLLQLLNIDVGFDIAGIINFLINVPLFILAYKYISKTFFRRSLVCVIFQTIFLTFIPSPATPIVSDILTCVLIGGMIAGFGSGMVLSASGSGGGTDIIGILISMRNRKSSVGKISISVNVVIYIICGLLYNVSTMIYSIIYAVIASLVVDNTHSQNISSYVMVFTKKKPEKIIDFIKNDLNRDATFWEGKGGYKETETFITYSVLSKYEMQRLERHLTELDPNSFMVMSQGIGIEGNFIKKLTE